jgi:hypothetical protein
VADTVLIAPPDRLSSLTERNDFRAAVAFADADALAAFDAITRQRPRLVAVERSFAVTPRGAALIQRIRTDPTLASCEVAIVSHDGAGPDANIASGASGIDAPLATDGELDPHGTRLARRFPMRDGLGLTLDGNPAGLIDLSIGGAQVVSPMPLRPHQRVRVSLPDSPRPLRIGAAVQWANFEMARGGPQYRAGLKFLDADAEKVERFIAVNRRE